MSRINTNESAYRVLEATKLLVKVEKKFFKHNVKQSSKIREKLNRLRLKKKDNRNENNNVKDYRGRKA